MGLTAPSVVLYAVKTFMQVTIYALQVVLPNEVRQARKRSGSLSFRSFGAVSSRLTVTFRLSLTDTLQPAAVRCTERCI